jgi:hypothetical protein
MVLEATVPAQPADREAALREKLQIPKDANRVLIFGETSHWDPNWVLTSERFYNLRVRHIPDAVRLLL